MIARTQWKRMRTRGTVRESTTTAVRRSSPEAEHVKAENKQTGTEQRSTIDPHAASATAQSGKVRRLTTN